MEKDWVSFYIKEIIHELVKHFLIRLNHHSYFTCYPTLMVCKKTIVWHSNRYWNGTLIQQSTSLSIFDRLYPFSNKSVQNRQQIYMILKYLLECKTTVLLHITTCSPGVACSSSLVAKPFWTICSLWDLHLIQGSDMQETVCSNH